ncbi:ATP-binding protein [Stackebrandtia nassauensis]|uniref:Magnesium chelatase n=1 Tax=Stackebrandtia nassauensis (strain DSM 44728 / CIP 108903 / NRRL B-16338 / NBRC 102104 / LLR-40K-21) TaxID=446470 RepID=D3PWN2_STANL|nr:AAA family ATPase [Stackebrandtia nassauensis]ADD43254.1 Magnesium chelatase [Stackebrandtia nassauensis DSM 44728]
MTDDIQVLPYSYVVGQDALKHALEISYVSRGSGGVLIAGERGTAKSTTVRAFTRMVNDRLPVTLPINATDDRVLGGWRIEELMRGEARPQPGLLETANDGVLYIDEVNLLDDHLVNVILDVASTGILVVQREGRDEQIPVSFTLVGTMNPEEGGLRPQLLDRFGMAVPVSTETDVGRRAEILSTVLRFDVEGALPSSTWLSQGTRNDQARREALNAARDRVSDSVVSDKIVDLCAQVATEFKATGHRSEIVMVNAARAETALDGRTAVEPRDVAAVAPFALLHRRPEAAFAEDLSWTAADQKLLDALTTE